ncbi:MAG: imidazolonepropionase, partial [Methanomassiliicoccales archaeon]
GVTCRAAKVLGLPDRGAIREGCAADLVGFPCSRFEEIIYRQGTLRPSIVMVGGDLIDACNGG